MGTKHITTCTAPRWNVSTTTGDGIEGTILSVFRVYENMRNHRGGFGRIVKGEADGMRFPSVEAASAYALERGYTTVYYPRTWCCKHRRMHTFMGRPSPTHHDNACTADKYEAKMLALGNTP